MYSNSIFIHVKLTGQEEEKEPYGKQAIFIRFLSNLVRNQILAHLPKNKTKIIHDNLFWMILFIF